MPISADKELELLNRYHLQSIYPSEWPHKQDDDADESDSEDETAQKPRTITHHRSKPSIASTNSISKYRNIDRHASGRVTSLSGTQKTTNGEDSLVQKDERDPLGQHQSVVVELRRRGLPVDDNVKLRNRFMLSSTSFSPQMFLSNVHQEATTDDLLQGLKFLSKSIDEKSASLKVLVESNFEKFVRAKATIDNVYTEMRSHGASEAGGETLKVPHNRRTSRNPGHFRNTSNSFMPSAKTTTGDKKKTALTKETEYGVQGLKAPLLEVAVKAEEVWGPALGGQEKEGGLRTIMSSMEQHRDIYRLNKSIEEAIVKHDYDNVIADWNKAKKYADEARQIASVAETNQAELGEQDVTQILITARMWHEIQLQMDVFKQDTWRRLKSSHSKRLNASNEERVQDLHMELIGVLLQLGVDENPIWTWLSSRVTYLRNRVTRSFERARIEIEILRRRSAQVEQVDPKVLAGYLRAANDVDVRSKSDYAKRFDSPAVLTFWEYVSTAMNTLLSLNTGILGEVVEFWEAAKDFIEGRAQKSFPNAVFAAGLEHLSLEPDEVENVQAGAVELVSLVRDNIFAFFSDPPVTDLSSLYSPLPPTPGSARSFSFDASTVPPPSAKKGDAWEKFAFWPPHSNSLSGSHHLSRILALVGTAAAELANLSVIRAHRSGPESFKALVGTVRERCMQAVVAAWIPDAERCKYMEIWTRHPDRRDLTTMPATFIAFEEKVLTGMQKIAYVSDATNSARNGEEVIVPPSAKLLQTIRSAFVTSLYKALSGMVENAEKLKSVDGRIYDPDGITVSGRGQQIEGVESATIDFNDRNVRLLMTLSNLSHLRGEAISQLISQFESALSVKLTEETKTIRDVLTQIDARLFQSYVKPTAEKVQLLITRGITDPSWPPASGRPDNARQYVYEVLLSLVYVHAEVSTTAAPLTGQILAYLLEQAGVALITAFKARPRYALPALMQATLDVEFLAQTLNNYTTDRASEVQSQIYLVLDERTEQDARARLEGELPEMRAVLKRLREGTKGQFGCFRRDRRGRENKPGSAGGGSAVAGIKST